MDWGICERNQRLKCKKQNCGGPSGGLLFIDPLKVKDTLNKGAGRVNSEAYLDTKNPKY